MVNLASTKAQNTARILALMGKTADIFRTAWRDQNTEKWRELEARAELARQKETAGYREAQLGLGERREARAERKEVWEQEKYAEEAPVRAEERKAAEQRTLATRERTAAIVSGQALAGQEAKQRIRGDRRDLIDDTEKNLIAERKALQSKMELTGTEYGEARETFEDAFTAGAMGKVGLGALFSKGDVGKVVDAMGVNRGSIMARWGQALASIPEGRRPETFLEALEFMPYKGLRDTLKDEYERHGKDAAMAEVGWESDRELIYAHGELALETLAAREKAGEYDDQHIADMNFLRRMRFGEVLSDEWMADLRTWTRERGEQEPTPEPTPAPGPDILDMFSGSTGTSGEW